MYGGSGKLGRGRGGGPVKRNIHSAFQPSSVQRPSAPPAGGRLSAGGGNRNRSNTPVAPVAVSTADETFSLVRNNPLNFGMIIRLAPVLVEEIKRLEAQGGGARIKFDASAKNPAGNIIDVGGKEFNFTWSQETGDLCDIYEERESGDNGNGLLVESGGAWRKLNVHRELDESVKNHVKMRTVEADRKHKSRTAIVLDHSSTKNQMKAVSAAEVNNTWRGGSYKSKKEPPFKKMKSESYSAPPNSGGKPRLPSSTPSKVRTSASPLLSTPEQSGAPLSPLKNNNIPKVNKEDAILTQNSKENARVSEKEMVNRSSVDHLQNKPESNEKIGNKPTDLQSLLISLLMEKPQGMYFKALEKAVGDTIPKSVKQIEPILKKIAVLQGSGRYILKPNAELESESSPENNHHHIDTTLPESIFPSEANYANPLAGPPHEELSPSEKIDIEHRSPDDKKEVPAGPTGSSSVSGSDSDSESDSSDSGSPNRSSVSGSGSDSESDASSNSKQGSDEDVDIMSDDNDKELVPEQKLLNLGNDEKDEDIHGSDFVDLEKDLFGDDNTNNNNDQEEADMHVVTDKDGDNYIDETKTISKRGLSDEREPVKRLKTGDPPSRPVKVRNSFSESPLSDVGPGYYDYEKLDNREFLGNSASDSPKSGVRSIDLNARAKGYSERGGHGNDGFTPQKDRRPPKNSKHSGSHPKKNDPLIGKIKESGLSSTSQVKDSPIVNGRGGAVLQREVSDLEMGEFRENVLLEASGTKKRFERNNSFNKPSSDSKGKLPGRTSLDQSASLSNKKLIPEDHIDDSIRLNGKPQIQPPSRVDHMKSGPHQNLGPTNNKGRQNEAGAGPGVGSDGYSDSQRKAAVGPTQKYEKPVGPPTSKKQKSNDLGEKKKDFWLVDNRDNGQKKREMESSSDDSITSYTKYEKEEPEMKGPIRDLSQYNDYVQEYHEKFDCYHTLNKILESYRNEFQNFGRDLELAKGRDNDRYNNILEQLVESYRQCGTKHKRLKKIFVVLHHELQHLKEMIREFAEKQTKG